MPDVTKAGHVLVRAVRCASQLGSKLSCRGAVDALCEVGAIDTLLSNFIRPLQGEAIATVKRDPLTSHPILDPQGAVSLQTLSLRSMLSADDLAVPAHSRPLVVMLSTAYQLLNAASNHSKA